MKSKRVEKIRAKELDPDARLKKKPTNVKIESQNGKKIQESDLKKYKAEDGGRNRSKNFGEKI